MTEETIRTGDGRMVYINDDAAPDAYSAGGVAISTKVSSVENAEVSTDDPNYHAVVSGTAANEVTVQLYQASVDTTTSNATQAVDYTEVADAADISALAVSLTAYRA